MVAADESLARLTNWLYQIFMKRRPLSFQVQLQLSHNATEDGEFVVTYSNDVCVRTRI